MLIIQVKPGEKIERALKRYKRKVDQTKQIKHLRDRMYYEKPSAKKRRQKLKAIYVEQFKRNEEER